MRRTGWTMMTISRSPPVHPIRYQCHLVTLINTMITGSNTINNRDISRMWSWDRKTTIKGGVRFVYCFSRCSRVELNSIFFQQDIQKRLSLPVDIKLPQNVVEKLNKTPTLDNPLTRKNRRASLVSFSLNFSSSRGIHQVINLWSFRVKLVLARLRRIRKCSILERVRTLPYISENHF